MIFACAANEAEPSDCLDESSNEDRLVHLIGVSGWGHAWFISIEASSLCLIESSVKP